jgi:hypothetical protein
MEIFTTVQSTRRSICTNLSSSRNVSAIDFYQFILTLQIAVVTQTVSSTVCSFTRLVKYYIDIMHDVWLENARSIYYRLVKIYNTISPIKK